MRSLGISGGGLNGLEPAITLSLCGSLESVLVTMKLEREVGQILRDHIRSNALGIAPVSLAKENSAQGSKALTKLRTPAG